MPKDYVFRIEGTDETVSVDFETMMTADSGGFLTLPSGKQARRVRELEGSTPKKRDSTTEVGNKPIVSDAMGFHASQLKQFEADRIANGFGAIEFRKDPCGYGYQTVCHDRKAWAKYIAHRGMVDNNGNKTAKVFVDLDKARKLIEREHGDA